MKVTICCLLFISFAFAQFDQSIEVGQSITLTRFNQSDFSSDWSGSSLNQELILNSCRVKSHQVRSVQTDNGPNNSGTYLKFEMVNGGPADIEWEFSTELENGNVFQSDVCNSGDTCEYNFFCDPVPDQNNFFILLNTVADFDTSANFTEYNITVIQRVDEVQIIPSSRTLTQSNSVDDVVYDNDPSVGGVENFVHYYHDLVLTQSESTQGSDLYVQVNNFNNISGDVVLCVSFEQIVYDDSNSGYVTSVFDADGLPTDQNTPAQRNNPCSNAFCSDFSIVNGEGGAFVRFDICDDCPGEMFIAVRPPVGSTYDVFLTTDAPTTEQFNVVSLTPGKYDGSMNSDSCDPDDHDFSCERYYSIPTPTFSSKNEFVTISLKGIVNGDIDFVLSTNLGGEAECGCNPATQIASCNAPFENCVITLGCDVVDSISEQTLFLTATATSISDTDFPVTFSMEYSSGQQSLESIDPFEAIPVHGEISLGEYHHYSVQFDSSDIKQDSRFTVELFPADPTSDELALAWNFGDFAGNNGCFDFLGYCETTTGCNLYSNGLGGFPGSFDNYCRFSFFPCDYELGVTEAQAGSTLSPGVSNWDSVAFNNGVQVGSLSSGTYFFSVFMPSLTSDDYDTTVEYTLVPSFIFSAPIFDEAVLHGSVYYGEFSQQYFLTLPSDPSFTGIDVTFENVQNGDVDFFISCGVLAGPCPCYQSVDATCSLSSAPSANVADNECTLHINRCQCDSDIIYISAFGTLPGDAPKQPAGFTMSAVFQTYTDNTNILPITVERTETVHVNGILNNNDVVNRINYLEQGSGNSLSSDLYFIDFENVETSPYLSLSVSVSVQTLQIPSVDQFVYLSIGKNSPLSIIPQQIDSVDHVGDYHGCEGLFCQADFDPDYIDPVPRQTVNQKRSLNQYFIPYLGDTGLEERRYSKCELEVYQCSSLPDFPCTTFPSPMRLDFESLLIITVASPIDGYSSVNGVKYTLDVTLVDNTPVVLTDSLAITSSIDFGYKHYYYEASNIQSNSRLSFRLYRKANHDNHVLRFYFNYDSSDSLSSDSLAGDVRDCLSSTFCTPCVLDTSQKNDCFFDLQPCDVSQKTGTYYLSVNVLDEQNSLWLLTNTDLQSEIFSIYNTPSVLDYEINAQDAIKNTWDSAQYTVSANVFLMEEIITSTSSSVTGTVSAGEMKHYHFSIPSDSSNSAGRITKLTIFSPESVFYSIDTVQPDDLCHSPDSMDSTTVDTPFRWERTPCDVTSTDYYVTVSGGLNIPFDYAFNPSAIGCEEISYSIRVDFVDILEVSLSLSSVSPSGTSIRSIYNSTESDDDDQNALALSKDETVVYTFDPNLSGNGEEFFVIDIFQEDGSGEPFDVYLARGSPYFPNSASLDCTFIDNALGVTNPDLGDVRFMIDDCSSDADDRYYITFVGNSGSDEDTDVITTYIRVFQTVRLIDVPSSNNLVALTNVTYDNPDEVERYLFRTVSSLGMDGGDTLVFEATGVATFEVNRADSAQCSVTCSDNGGGAGTRTCRVLACQDISSAVWYFHIETDTLGLETISIELIPGNDPVNSLSVDSLSINNEESFTALSGNPGDIDAQFRYHSFSVSSSEDSRYELLTTGINENDIFYVEERTFFPSYTAASDEVMLSSNGEVSSICVVAQTESDLPSSDCCNLAVSATFAVIGGGSNYTLEMSVNDNIAEQRNIGTTGSLSSQVVPVDQVYLINAQIPSDRAFYFSFSVENGSAAIYSNSGEFAGTDDSNDLGAGCYGNDGLLNSICPGFMDSNDEPCTGFVPICERCTLGGSDYTFAIYSDGNDEAIFNFEIAQSEEVETLRTGSNNNIAFPFEDDIDDNSDVSDDFATFIKLQYTYDGSDEDTFVPVSNDPTLDEDLYPRIQFVFSNFERANGSSIANPFEVFISDGTFDNDCYSADNIDSSRGLYPCMENNDGSAIFNDTFIICTIKTCDIGCGSDIFFSLARANNDDTQYRFDVDITELFDDLDDFVEIDTFAIDGSTNTFTFNQGSNTADVDVVYVRTTYSIDPREYPVFTVTTSQNDTTEIDVDMFSSLESCQDDSNAVNMCNGLVDGDICTWEWDPCTASENDGSVVYFRFTRTSGIGNWGFVFDAPLIDPPVVDQSDTTLQVITPSTISSVQSFVSDSYSATKFITQGTWQFYQFTVSENNGYSWLNVNVENFLCDVSGSDIEVYFSFGDSFTDVVKPDRVPTADCNVLEIIGSDSNSPGVMDTCQFVAGSYWVGIHAPVDTQIFPDPIDDDDEYQITYDISATLMSYQNDAIVCGDIIDTSVPAVLRREYLLPDGNINSATTITMTNLLNPSDSSSTLLWSTVIPEGTPGGVCEAEQMSCSFVGGSCTFDILPENNNGGTLFMYLDTAELSQFQFSATHTDQYIPVWDLSQGSIDETFCVGDGRLVAKVLSNGVSFESVISSVGLNECTNPSNITVSYALSDEGALLSGLDYQPSDCDSCICSDNEVPCDTIDLIGSTTCLDTLCGENSFYIIFESISSQNVNVKLTPRQTTTVSFDSIVTLSCENTVLELPDPSSQAVSLRFESSFYSEFTLSYATTLDQCVTTPLPALDCTGEVCTLDLDPCAIDYPKYIFIECTNSATCLLFDNIRLESAVTIDFSVVTSDPDSTLISRTFSSDTVLGTNDSPIFAGYPIKDITTSLCVPTCTKFIPAGTTVYFTQEPETSNFSPISLANTRSFNLDGGETFGESFVVTIPSSPTASVTINIDNFESDNNVLDVTSLDFRYEFSSSPADVPNSCSDCSTLNAFGSSGDCSGDFLTANEPLSCTDTGDVYIYISLCAPTSCGISFDISVTLDTTTLTTADGGDHRQSFTVFDPTQASVLGCSTTASVSSPTTFLIPSGPLAVLNVRYADPGTSTISDLCGTISDCTTGTGADCSCETSSDSCALATSCQTSSEQILTLSGAQMEYQLVTEYVPLTSGFNNVDLYGKNAHFYSISNADSSSLVLTVTVKQGPGVTVQLSAGCGMDSDFVEFKKCLSGDCRITIPTWAKNPMVETLVVSIYGEGEVDTNYGDFEKNTVYDISQTQGLGNCISFPNVGFCSGISGITNQVWESDFDTADARAQCMVYDDLFDCSTPTDECTELLRQYSCLKVYPQCSADGGYQMGICTDLCSRIESTCGLPGFCCRDFHAPGSAGSCVSLPAIPSPTPAISDPSDIFAGAEETPEVPSDGDPIVLSIPSQDPIYIDTENKMVRKVEASSSSTLFVSFLLVLLVALF